MENFCKEKNVEHGTSNPALMEKSFWKYMVANPQLTAFCAAKQNKDHKYNGQAIWCFARFGSTHTYLPDGRLVCIGGEHEDSYDQDFQIYNDVIVIRNPCIIEGDCIYSVPIPSNYPRKREENVPKRYRYPMLGASNVDDVTIYGYPKNVFPPTDFHTATYVKDNDKEEFIYIIGGTGCPSRCSCCPEYDASHYEETRAYRLRLSDFTIQEIKTSGNKPVGVTREHSAKLVNTDEGRQIIVEGRMKEGDCEGDRKDDQCYAFNIETAEWKVLTNKQTKSK
jgi:hypothetical protein